MLIMKINSHEVIYIPSFLKLRLYKSRIIKDNRFAGPKILLLHGRKSHHLSKTVDNCLLRDLCDVIFYFYNFKDFQWFSFEEICFFLNYNYMELWIKDVWKNSKCDSDNKRHLKKRKNRTHLVNELAQGRFKN